MNDLCCNISEYGNNSILNKNLIEAIRTRRTVRKYQPKQIHVDVIEKLINEVIHAPTACNIRGWRFVYITDKKRLVWLYEKGGAAFIKEARQALLICYYNITDNDEWDDYVQSAAAAIAYLQLLAHSQGIGSCWVCHLPPKREIRKYFNIPRHYDPIALLTMGYYRSDLKVTIRKVISDRLISIDSWNFPEIGKESFCYKRMIKKIVRKIYYMIPMREYIRDITKKYEKKFDNEL